MPYFSGIIHGEGNLIDGLTGFYTSAIGKAANEEEAKHTLLKIVERRCVMGDIKRFTTGFPSISLDELFQIPFAKYHSAKMVNFLRLGGILPTIPERGSSYY